MRSVRSDTVAGGHRTRRLLTLAVGSAAVLGLPAVVPASRAGAAAPGWIGVQAPVPANSTSFLGSSSDATTCAAPGSCESVGEYHQGAQTLLDADTLADGAWTSVQIPLPVNALSTYEPFFRAVRCPSPTWCTALGSYRDLQDHSQAFTSTLSAGSWTTSEVLLPPAAADPTVDVYENELACPQVGTCYTVGTYMNASDDVAAFIDTLSGGPWTTLPAPAPSSNSITCASATSCTAVGQFYDPTGVSGLIVTLSGGTWTAARAPVPAGFAPTYEDLYDVSCPTQGTCFAVG